MEIQLPGRGKAMMDLILERVAALSISDEATATAHSIVKGAGVPGLDPAKLHSEWKSDVLASDDEVFETARIDPSRTYLEWLSDRVKDPYRVSFRAVQAFTRNRDLEGVNEFVHLRWPQELAWGHRLRASREDRVAFLSALFLRQVANNSFKVFQDVAAAFESAMSDFTFSSAPEHRLNPRAIRLGREETGYRPAFLRLFEIRFSTSLDTMTAVQIAAGAAKAREDQSVDRNLALGEAAASAARSSPMSRLFSVIQVAIDTHRSPDQLVVDEAAFLDLVRKGSIELATGGLPHLEFIRWLRGTAPSTPSGGHVADPQYPRVLGNPRQWVERLSSDFHDLGGKSMEKVTEWLAPIVSGKRPVPLDCVVDYGFHLVVRVGRMT